MAPQKIFRGHASSAGRLNLQQEEIAGTGPDAEAPALGAIAPAKHFSRNGASGRIAGYIQALKFLPEFQLA